MAESRLTTLPQCGIKQTTFIKTIYSRDFTVFYITLIDSWCYNVEIKTGKIRDFFTCHSPTLTQPPIVHLKYKTHLLGSVSTNQLLNYHMNSGFCMTPHLVLMATEHDEVWPAATRTENTSRKPYCNFSYQKQRHIVQSTR